MHLLDKIYFIAYVEMYVLDVKASNSTVGFYLCGEI
jgi:hypothetical protein